MCRVETPRSFIAVHNRADNGLSLSSEMNSVRPPKPGMDARRIGDHAADIAFHLAGHIGLVGDAGPSLWR